MVRRPEISSENKAKKAQGKKDYTNYKRVISRGG